MDLYQTLLDRALNGSGGGGGGGSLGPIGVLRPDAELCYSARYNKLAIAEEGYVLPSFVTNQQTVKASETLPEIELDYDTYNYWFCIYGLATPQYSLSSHIKGEQDYFLSARYGEICSHASGTIGSRDGTQHASTSLAYVYAGNEWNLIGYWRGASAFMVDTNAAYGANLVINPPSLKSRNSNILEIPTPALQLRGDATYLSSNAWAALEDIRYQYSVELWRSPVGDDEKDGWPLRQLRNHCIGCAASGDPIF